MAAKLHVSNLPAEATEQTIRDLFAKAGTVVSVALTTDLSTEESKRFALVEMASVKETRVAIAALDGYQLGECIVAVRMALRREVPYHNRSRPKREPGM